MFTPDMQASPGSYTIRIICNDTDTEVFDELFIQVYNNEPLIVNVKSSQLQINRTKSLKLFINVSDNEIHEKNLDVRVIYKSPYDLNWQDNYINNKKYVNDHWQFDFVADKNAKIGKYKFRIICNDSYTEVFEDIEILVLNNVPIIDKLIISESSANRTESIQIIINTFDVETQDQDLEIDITHQITTDSFWNDDYISNQKYIQKNAINRAR